MSGLERFQEHLRELFQLDTADLDFGIYRLFAARREEVDRFIEKELTGPQMPRSQISRMNQQGVSKTVRVCFH